VLQSDVKQALIKGFGACHVIDMDFKPNGDGAHAMLPVSLTMMMP
jgi:hypothetical protein